MTFILVSRTAVHTGDKICTGFFLILTPVHRHVIKITSNEQNPCCVSTQVGCHSPRPTLIAMMRTARPFVSIQRCWTMVLVAANIFLVATCFIVKSGSKEIPNRIITSSLCMAPSQSAKDRLASTWFPRTDDGRFDDDIFAQDGKFIAIEKESLRLMATLIKNRLEELKYTPEAPPTTPVELKSNKAYELAKGRFLHLTCTLEGEQILENLFLSPAAAEVQEKDVIYGAIISLQSLCIAAMQTGIKGTPDQLQRMVAHLRLPEASVDVTQWNEQSIRRIKYEVNQAAGTQLLAALAWKRSSLGAFELLVALGAWSKHEDISLLRSGFPIRFTDEQEAVAREAATSTSDPDRMLGIRKDLRHQKVYTIDGVSTYEIDDGLSVEVVENADGTTKQRFWVHIADADRWAPRHTEIFELAQRRWTSHYLPGVSIPMFPSVLSQAAMSLTANTDVCALSLGVELNPDGSIDAASIEVTPSEINVSFRLTYDDVDEMLEEGVGYSEEWQLGALHAAATKRRKYRMKNGSTEAMIPNPMPQVTVSTFPDKDSPDGIGIKVGVEATHNTGKNITADAECGTLGFAAPASPSFMLVTEMMIMAGEALGAWKFRCDNERINAPSFNAIDNGLRLPFRAQPKPDFLARSSEYNVMKALLDDNVGGGYCQAWYARRFFSAVKISEQANPHSGLGIDSYVQWTSPIRRLSDLLVHCAVKRYLRREKVNELIKCGKPLPSQLSEADLGCPIPSMEGTVSSKIGPAEVDRDIDYARGQALVTASRQVQRNSQQYWLFEYLSRRMETDPPVFNALVLGCVDNDKQQYVLYLPEIGFEQKYISEMGELLPGDRLNLRISSIMSRTGLLTLTLAKT